MKHLTALAEVPLWSSGPRWSNSTWKSARGAPRPNSVDGTARPRECVRIDVMLRGFRVLICCSPVPPEPNRTCP